jgi:hypothetical protein
MTYIIVKDSVENGKPQRMYACEVFGRYSHSCQPEIAKEFQTKAEALRIRKETKLNVGWRVIRVTRVVSASKKERRSSFQAALKKELDKQAKASVKSLAKAFARGLRAWDSERLRKRSEKAG